MTTYTAFVHQSNGTGPVWIHLVEADDERQAEQRALSACASERGLYHTDGAPDTSGLVLMGLAAGDVEVLDWDDTHLWKD